MLQFAYWAPVLVANDSSPLSLLDLQNAGAAQPHAALQRDVAKSMGPTDASAPNKMHRPFMSRR